MVGDHRRKEGNSFMNIPETSRDGKVRNDGKPTALRVQSENIPAELRALDQWVVWRYEFRQKKWTKPPYTIHGESASSTDPKTWTTFTKAIAAYEAGGWDGVGLIHLP